MPRLPRIFGLKLLPGLLLAAGWAPACSAATSATLDILPAELTGPAERVELGNLKPLIGPKKEVAKPAVSGNPLWSVPLSALTATRERPIFSASRRPAQRAVAGPPIEPVAVPLAKPPEPERPALALIGAVVGDSDAIAVFLDRTNQKIVRLRAGEAHTGWVLSSVLPREATLKKADQTEVLELRPDGPVSPGVPGAPGAPAVAAVPPMPSMVSGVAGSYAPVIPRSAPKNGESDGL
jgi:general secretion pathway protein N